MFGRLMPLYMHSFVIEKVYARSLLDWPRSGYTSMTAPALFVRKQFLNIFEKYLSYQRSRFLFLQRWHGHWGGGPCTLQVKYTQTDWIQFGC